MLIRFDVEPVSPLTPWLARRANHNQINSIQARQYASTSAASVQFALTAAGRNALHRMEDVVQLLPMRRRAIRSRSVLGVSDGDAMGDHPTHLNRHNIKTKEDLTLGLGHVLQRVTNEDGHNF